MNGSLDDERVRNLLGYLDDVGFHDLYVRPTPFSASAPRAPESITAGATKTNEPSHLATVGATVGSVTVGAPSAGDLDLPSAAAALDEIAVRVASCTRCRLCEGRNKTVFGSGDPRARLMFIGEGPGAEEDRQGLPFVGRAGELLTKIIQAIELSREQVYIANIVKCRPPGNRDPQPDEVVACRSYLERQIEIVRPRVLVALGRIAAQTLLGNEDPIGRMRGRWVNVFGVPTMVTYHPAALLRNPALKRPTWEDMQEVRNRLREIE